MTHCLDLDKSAMTQPRLRSVMICDDVRTENTGKEILIGVYVGNIRFFGPPPGVLSQLCFRCEYEPDQEEKQREFRLQLVSPYGTPILDLSGSVRGNQKERWIIGIQHRNLVLSEAGLYQINMGFDGNVEQVDTVDVSFNRVLPQVGGSKPA